MANLFLSGTLAIGLILGCAANAWAADPEREAQERYANAVKLYEEGAYDAALVELNRAAELKPSYKLYFNIAQVRFAMHDYAAAMDAYRQYLEKGADRVPAARREQVQKELNKLAQRVAKLSVEVDVPGAEVLVDDVVVGTSPLAGPIVVNSGIRRVSVRHPEYVPQSRKVTLAGNVQDRISFSLLSPGATPGESEPAANGPTPATTTAPPAPSAESRAADAANGPEPAEPLRTRGSSTGMWIGWAVTGALAAGAAVTGIVTLSKDSALEEARGDLAVSNEELENRASEVRTLATVTDALAIGAVLAGGVSLWLTLSRDSGETTTPNVASATPRPRWAVALAPGRVTLKTSF
jgi:hypothetical protein